MFNKTVSIALFFFAFLLSATGAIVINPKITTPNSGTKWRAGQTVKIKWSTTYFDGSKQVPIPDTNKGAIKLGYLEAGDKYNEHLFWDLASNLELNTGFQTVTLPNDLPTRTDYIIVLMGDSGNASKKFTIRSK